MIMTNFTQKDLEYALTDPLLVDYDVLALQKLAKTLSKTAGPPTTEERIIKVAVCGGFMTKFLLELACNNFVVTHVGRKRRVRPLKTHF